MLHVRCTCVQGMRYTLRIPYSAVRNRLSPRLRATPRAIFDDARVPLVHPRVHMQGRYAWGGGGRPRSRSAYIYAREIPRGCFLPLPRGEEDCYSSPQPALSSAKSRLHRRSSPAKIRLGRRVRRLLQPEILVDAPTFPLVEGRAETCNRFRF